MIDVVSPSAGKKNGPKPSCAISRMRLTVTDNIKIFQATSKQEYDHVRNLFSEYAALLNVDLCFQNFEKECSELPGEYSPPSGRLFLCACNSQIAGCAALKKIKGDICEMKRLYVRPEYRRKGLGKLLSLKMIEEALRIGYTRMRLDTLSFLKEALELYSSLGFKEIEPYYHNPLDGVIFLELALRSFEKPEVRVP